MPSRADIDPLDIPGEIWPHTMLLDVLWHDGLPRFRYRRVGNVVARALGQEPTGRFIDEVLPETAGYRAYILGIYREMATRRSALYREYLHARWAGRSHADPAREPAAIDRWHRG